MYFSITLYNVNTLNAELIPICNLLALLGVYHFLHVSRIRVNNISLLQYVKPEAAITVSELLIMSGVSLETRWAIKKHRNNKFYYTVASGLLFLYDLNYDARIREHQVCILCSFRSSPQWARASSLSSLHDHTHLDTPQSVGLLWTSDQPDAETSAWQHTTLTRQTSMTLAEFKSIISANERIQTLALDRTATGIDTGVYFLIYLLIYLLTYLLTPWNRVLLEKLTGKICS
jgi:hypothetical protein